MRRVDQPAQRFRCERGHRREGIRAAEVQRLGLEDFAAQFFGNYRVRPREMRQTLQSLDDRSRRIIKARWLAESEPMTLHELADEFGVSAERIRQIEVKAMQKMKTQLATLH